MLVIEGRSGKSVFIQRMMDANNAGNLLLDTVGVKGLVVTDGSEHLMLQKETTLNELGELLNELSLNKFNRVILLINSSKEMLYDIRKLSYKFPEQKFIVTVQSELENIKTYEY